MRGEGHDGLQDVFAPGALDGVRACEEICTHTACESSTVTMINKEGRTEVRKKGTTREGGRKEGKKKGRKKREEGIRLAPFVFKKLCISYL